MKKLIIVDLRDILKDHYKRKQQHRLFKVLKIEVLLESLLSVNYYVDYSDIVHSLIDQVIDPFSNEDVDDLDMTTFDLLVEALINEVDQQITKKARVSEDSYYLFEAWLGESSVILEVCYDNNVYS